MVEQNKLKDFRNFLYLCWKHLKLPEPTPIQYDMANFIQSGDQRLIIEAFRGVGKSWITSAYVCHQLLLNPQVNILVVSASKTRADDFSTFTLRLINEMPLLQHLIPSESQRQSKISFDVKPARASHQPSVKSLGITGQLAGSRADLIVADDVEVPNNSQTQGMREKLSESVKEFESIIKPKGRILFLGTPQTEQSLYNLLPERGYRLRIWTAKYPTDKQLKNLSINLAPKILKEIQNDKSLENKSTDPKRFTDEDLMEREASYGRTGFAMQFMLDTRLSDLDKFPLKLSDLVVMNLNPDKAPEKVIWATSPELKINDIPCVGLNGDAFYRPMAIQGDWADYTGSVMAIDPSGRGKDETAYAVVKMLHGQLFVTKAGGLSGGYDDQTLQKLCDIAKEEKVNLVLIESNFGDGMFTKMITPFFMRTHKVTIEEIRHSQQKEKRIVDTLEPVLNQHRLIINQDVIDRDYASTQHLPPESALRYQLFYQMSRITRERGSLAHDDRLDVLSMAVGYWVEQMAKDVDMAMKDRKTHLMRQELDRFMQNAVGRKPQALTWM
tara:strand:- start:1227 stop:2891 length:1665 start_codon:yes stop_codon:yes gene_type:complete